MRNPEALGQMTTFAATEYSEESLEFMRAVRKFRTNTTHHGDGPISSEHYVRCWGSNPGPAPFGLAA